jgi:hypothetical protein
MIVGLAASLPSTMSAGLRANGVPPATAQRIAHLPPVGSLFAAFLGYNPMQKLLGAPGPHGSPSVLVQLPKAKAANLTGKTFFRTSSRARSRTDSSSRSRCRCSCASSRRGRRGNAARDMSTAT